MGWHSIACTVSTLLALGKYACAVGLGGCISRFLQTTYILLHLYICTFVSCNMRIVQQRVLRLGRVPVWRSLSTAVHKKVAVLPGDGVGPEVMDEALKARNSHTFSPHLPFRCVVVSKSITFAARSQMTTPTLRRTSSANPLSIDPYPHAGPPHGRRALGPHFRDLHACDWRRGMGGA